MRAEADARSRAHKFQRGAHGGSVSPASLPTPTEVGAQTFQVAWHQLDALDVRRAVSRLLLRMPTADLQAELSAAVWQLAQKYGYRREPPARGESTKQALI